MARSISLRQKSARPQQSFVRIPRGEYEALLQLRAHVFPTVKLSLKEKRAIAASERELQKGAYLTLRELEHELARTRTKTRK